MAFSVGSAGVVLKTENSGINWVENNLGFQYNFNSIFFVNANIGYIAGEDTSNLSAVVFKTIDGGNNWQKII